MLELLGTVLTGGATGIIGSVIGKAFSFMDFWVDEKKATNEHENERELEIVKTKAAGDARTASYNHDISLGLCSVWVTDVLRLVRPILTFALIGITLVLYLKANPGGRDAIEISVIYLTSSATLWWFGDRAMRKK